MLPLARLLPLLAAPLLLAGCASDGHGHGPAGHGEGPMPFSLLVGIENQGPHDLAVHARLLDANGTLAWESNFTAPAHGNPEKHTELPRAGAYTLEVVYRWQESGAERSGGDRATLDPDDCSGLSHLTFVVDTTKDANPQGVHRECHE